MYKEAVFGGYNTKTRKDNGSIVVSIETSEWGFGFKFETGYPRLAAFRIQFLCFEILFLSRYRKNPHKGA